MSLRFLTFHFPWLFFRKTSRNWVNVSSERRKQETLKNWKESALTTSSHTFEFDSCRKNQGQPHIFGEDECDNSKQQRLCLALRTFWPALKVFFLGQSSSCWSLGKHVFYTSYVDDALDLCYPWTYAVLRHLTRLTYLTWMSNKTGGLLVQVSTFSN